MPYSREAFPPYPNESRKFMPFSVTNATNLICNLLLRLIYFNRKTEN